MKSGPTTIAAALLLCAGCLGAAKVTPSASNGGGGQTQLSTSCGTSIAPGHYTLRRLTNTEYTNTVQDLLYTTQTPATSFEGSGAGPSGFTNDSTALSISSPLILEYYEAAEALAQGVIASKGTSGGAYSKLVTCSTSDASCATSAVTALAKRAFRRPPTSDDLDENSGLMAVFNASGTFDQGLQDVIVSLLISPDFLLLPVVNAQSTVDGAVFPLDDYQLATRLSYTIWQSMPDDELTAAADAGTLTQPDVLTKQVQRMLGATTQVANLKNTLRDEYAGMAELAQLDFTAAGQSNSLRSSMIGETDAFFADLIDNNRSPLQLLTSDESFVDQTMASFYGVSLPSGASPTAFTAVKTGRIGLGSQASVLTNTAGGDPVFTDPIKRGHWILDQLWCSPPGLPPATQPQLSSTNAPGQTIRQTLAQHTSDPVCASCHKSMDGFGLGAENFDRFGKWRTMYDSGLAVDASGSFPSAPVGDGKAWTTSTQMYTDLASEPRALSCVPQQLMSYALSRAADTNDDECVAAAIAKSSMVASGSFTDLVSAIVSSPQFLNQTGEAQ